MHRLWEAGVGKTYESRAKNGISGDLVSHVNDGWISAKHKDDIRASFAAYGIICSDPNLQGWEGGALSLQQYD